MIPQKNQLIDFVSEITVTQVIDYKPGELERFPRLKTIFVRSVGLSGNFFDVNFPSTVEVIWIDNNDFSGDINLDNLPNLIKVFGYSNNFSGVLPPALNIPTITNFHFGGNDISGNIDTLSSWNCPLITNIHLYTNNLSGSIPDLSIFPSLKWIDLSWNSGINSVHSGFAVSSTLNRFDCSGTALDQASVDLIISAIDTAGNSNGRIAVKHGSNAVPTNNAAFANLLNKGWVIDTN